MRTLAKGPYTEKESFFIWLWIFVIRFQAPAASSTIFTTTIMPMTRAITSTT